MNKLKVPEIKSRETVQQVYTTKKVITNRVTITEEYITQAVLKKLEDDGVSIPANAKWEEIWEDPPMNLIWNTPAPTETKKKQK